MTISRRYYGSAQHRQDAAEYVDHYRLTDEQSAELDRMLDESEAREREVRRLWMMFDALTAIPVDTMTVLWATKTPHAEYALRAWASRRGVQLDETDTRLVARRADCTGIVSVYLAAERTP